MHLSMFEKTVFCVVATGWIVWGISAAGDLLINPKPLKTAVFPAAAETAKKAGAEAAQPKSDAAAGGALTLLASADAAAGQKAFKKCKACHTTKKGGKNKVGPNLWDIVGRAKAVTSGYKFSSALAGLGGNWSYQDLDGFMANPKGFAKGTKMTFAGVKKAQARAALLLYLRSLSDQPKPLP
tara:strand:- start:7 stop:552 length:546 start_codon:yes stop_codon:yes gene_type:complete